MKQKFSFFAIAIILAACSSSRSINSAEIPSVEPSPVSTATSLPIPTNTSEPSPTVTPVPSVLLEDGIYIVGDSNTYEKISAVDDDSVLSVPTLPITPNNSPMFAIKGNDFPIGDIELYGYYAGIGIDTELVSLGSGKLAAKINQVYDNSPAKEAGLETGEIIFGVNGEAFQAIQLNFGFPPYRDLVGILNPNQSEITINVLSGTTERAVTLPKTYRLSGDNFKTNSPISSVAVEPNGDYVLLKVTWALESGIYRIEFKQNKIQKWVFVVP